MSNLFGKLFLILIYAFLSGCYIQKEGGSSSSAVPSFETEVAPLLSTNCATSGCHDATTIQAGLDFTIDDTRIADEVFTLINAGSLIDTEIPEDSILLTQASNSNPDDPHTGGEVLAIDSDEYKTVLNWITEGALNDDCTNIVHTFETDVTPIFANCTTSGCHDAGASLSLTPENAFAQIQDNDLVDIDKPIQSSLLQNALGLEGHVGGTIFNSTNEDDFRTIFCWIKVDQAIEN